MKKFLLGLFLLHFVAHFCAAQQTDVIKVKTFSGKNATSVFLCRRPALYDANSRVKYRLLVYFGGRNTDGEKEIRNKNWIEWCDKNGIFLLVPTFKDDNYWEPRKWSGKALLDAVEQLKKKYPNICDDKLLFYGYSAGAQCSNLFPAWIPEKSRAYVSHASGVFHKPNEHMKDVAGLLTCGDADRQRLVINHKFIEAYRRMGINVLWKSFPNHPHDVPEGSTFLAQAFLEHYHKLFACDLDASKPRLSENRKTLFVGDDLDGVVYEAGSPSAGQIYEEDKVFFTSKELSDAWEKSAAMP